MEFIYVDNLKGLCALIALIIGIVPGFFLMRWLWRRMERRKGENVVVANPLASVLANTRLGRMFSAFCLVALV